MVKRTSTPAATSDDQIRALLDRYQCPVPFHAVRTRFLGIIASPAPSVSPIETVKALWGGELPAFETLDAANELLDALVMGLWNRLTRHQERGAPFRLARVTVPETRESVARIASIRREEIDGFVEGLFGTQERLDLPERAHRALGTLSEMRALLEGVHAVVGDPAKPTTTEDIAGIMRRVHKMTKIAEHEVHEAVLSCARARRQMLRTMSSAKPTLN